MLKMGEMKMDEIFLLVITMRDNWMKRSDSQFNLSLREIIRIYYIKDMDMNIDCEVCECSIGTFDN